ncbi:MAG: hypothetical protein LBM16_00495 [Clostridiales bacterium]|jgi:hypothetical protein|nr:hypothetical protein [Clostridiales bacterium]
MAQEKPVYRRGTVLSAKIIEKEKYSVTLLTEKKEILNVRSGRISGQKGDRIYLEVLRDGNSFVMKQVFPDVIQISEDALKMARM